MFKQVVAAAVMVMGLSSLAHAADEQAVNRKDPYVMVEKAAQLAFDDLKAQQPQIQKNPNILKDIVRKDLLPYVDYRYASYKVIGRNLPKTTADQRNRFVEAFKNYLVTTYAQAFTQYKDQKVAFERDSLDDNGRPQRIASVKARIIQPGGQDISIIFKARLNSKTGEWGVYDMVAEGISLLSSKQAELEGLIRQKGIDSVIETLKEKANESITNKSADGSK
ncbi:MlaC/ttg2D family ABC transporter substrate-binding protein [Gallaecimonas mangrovi]|uniref:MlaC/ttg2D family ABC transporter substrate-binding protein n=1 Tax=Gallaecimonas mangrovi TaxID=2291597 RepID=UPI000E204B36|nr:ABC transporter substrate-binding protein [Gallaecimonas mangrovi]